MCTRASSSASSDLPLREGHRLAARVSGDSAVAFSWAYVQALEGMAGASAAAARAVAARAGAGERAHRQPPRRSRRTRQRCRLRLRPDAVLAAEGACGCARSSRRSVSAICSTTSFPAASPAISRPLNSRLLANRALDIAREARLIRSIYDEHAGVRDRFAGTGIVQPELAHQTWHGRPRGPGQRAGRTTCASTRRRNLMPRSASGASATATATWPRGSRCASMSCEESARLVARIADGLPDRHASVEVGARPRPAPRASAPIEGWRGPVLVALTAGARRRLSRAAIRTIRPGRTGRCWSTPSSATSFPTSR